MKEIWKDIFGFENRYQISNLGRIKSLKRFEPNRNSLRLVKERIRIPSLKKKGYLEIGLILGGKTYRKRLHRLVAIAFIPNPDNLPEINYKDGIKTNNIVTNLEWVTASENVKHAFNLGLKTAKGERNTRAILTEKDVLEIRKSILENPKIPYRHLAEKYKISTCQISAIKNRKSWTHI